MSPYRQAADYVEWRPPEPEFDPEPLEPNPRWGCYVYVSGDPPRGGSFRFGRFYGVDGWWPTELVTALLVRDARR